MDERAREEKEEGKEEERARGRWGASIDIDLLSLSVNGMDYGLSDVREAVREAFVQGFRNLADKTRIKDARGAYLYPLPNRIQVTTDTSQKFFLRFIFSCEMGETDSRTVRDAREN